MTVYFFYFYFGGCLIPSVGYYTLMMSNSPSSASLGKHISSKHLSPFFLSLSLLLFLFLLFWEIVVVASSASCVTVSTCALLSRLPTAKIALVVVCWHCCVLNTPYLLQLFHTDFSCCRADYLSHLLSLVPRYYSSPSFQFISRHLKDAESSILSVSLTLSFT